MNDRILLELVDVSKIFQTEYVQTYALRDISLSIANGEFVAITGPSGCGKSTLLNVLGLLDDFAVGRYIVDGHDVRSLSDRQKTLVRRDAIGFVFQNFNLISNLTVRQNVEVPLIYKGVSSQERRRLSQDILGQLGLLSRSDHMPSQLSGGQQQRVAIARALIGSPAVILADEPTGNLDTEMSLDIMRLIQSIHAKGRTIVMVTHNADCAAMAQRVIHIVDGRVCVTNSER